MLLNIKVYNYAIQKLDLDPTNYSLYLIYYIFLS